MIMITVVILVITIMIIITTITIMIQLWNLTEISLLHLMHTIACTHVSTLATSLMGLKKACANSVCDTYCLEKWNEDNERKIKNQGQFQQFIACNYHMQSPALFLNIFKCCTIFAQIFKCFALFQQFFAFFLKTCIYVLTFQDMP